MASTVSTITSALSAMASTVCAVPSAVSAITSAASAVAMACSADTDEALTVVSESCAGAEAGVSNGSTRAASISFDGAGGAAADGLSSTAAACGAAAASLPPSSASCRSMTSNAVRGLIDAISPQAPSMAPTWESIRSQIRPSAPISRHRQAISRMIRLPLRTGASFSSSARPSSAATRAASTAPLIAASASLSPLSGGAGGGCRWAARFSSSRATASSTMLVSALRLRLAYSPRNQRPREVSMNALLIAS